MKSTDIFIYPNYAIQFSNNTYLIEASHELLLKPLLKAGYKITIVGVLDKHSDLGNYKKVFSNDINFYFINKYRFNKIKLVYKIRYILYSFKIFKITRNSSINYIFIPGNIGVIISLFSLLLRQPYAIYYRGDWNKKTPRLFRSFKKMLFKNAKFIIYVGAVNDNNLFYLNEMCETVVPMLSIPFDNYKKDSSKLSGNKIRLLYIGEISVEKGIYELFHSIKNLHSKGYKNIYLTFVGKGKEFNNLHNIITKYNLQTHIILLGKITDSQQLIEIYSSHDIFCLPSYTEGFPRVLYEAMLFSLPIITTNVGKINTLLENYKNCLFIKTKDINDIEDKIELLEKNISLRINIGINNLNTIYPYINKWKDKTHGDQIVSWLLKSKI
jgi:glycosyltransferase involved in cell wall biosynthesis